MSEKCTKLCREFKLLTNKEHFIFLFCFGLYLYKNISPVFEHFIEKVI